MLVCVETNGILLVVWGLAPLTRLRESPPFWGSYQTYLCDFLCGDFTLLQPPRPSLLSNCRPVLYIWPTLSNLTTTITVTLPTSPPSLSLVPPVSPLQNIFLPISLHIIFSCLQRKHILGSPSSYWSRASPRPTSRGLDRGCLLSCYLSPS